jgi:hypothetical protein
MQSSLHREPTHTQEGAALIIILSFVVLLTGVIVAFLSRAISERQISNSSANEGKVEVFAEGAMETTLGDLKQEIVVGSTNTKFTTGTASVTLYFPNTNRTMVPCRVGTNDTLPNLVKRSASGQPFYSGAAYGSDGVRRAASTSSTTASLNSRIVSLSRWNKPLLIPKKTSGQSSDLTPSVDFIPPDWIYVDRSGNNPTAVSMDIVGRYAYCIYDEGGVLDLNIAGYPSAMDKSQASHKIGTSCADLTQTGMTSTQVDTIIGWRNYATIQPPGSFPSYNINAQSGTNYFNSAFSNPTGFLFTSNTALYHNQSDQMFASRQQMIQFLLQGIATNSADQSTLQDALQYLGTFSRSLEQPSFAPSYPVKVVGYSAAPTAGSGLFGMSSGGNDAYGLDPLINPSFLNVRATSTFSHNDGTIANVGEPLVKRRFALSRLAWLTYAGPSAVRNNDNPSSTGSDADIWALENTYGFSKAWLKQGTAQNVLAYFGLTWDATNKLWKYDHGVTSGGTTGIGKLSDVQSLGRDADFVELLKAGITVGSLAKGAASNHSFTSYPNLVDVNQYNLDVSVNNQIIQMTANIIDQFDCDGYPTCIHVCRA